MTVTINGKAYPVIGEVGLSHTAVDVTGSSVQPGDIATCDLSPLLVNPRVPAFIRIIQEATCILTIQVAFYFLNTLRRRFSILRAYNSSATPSSRS